MHAHLTHPPPKLSELRPDLPRELDRVIAKALAKSPDERFASASDLVDAAHAAVLQRRTTSVQAFESRLDDQPAAPAAEPPPVAATPDEPPAAAPPPPSPASCGPAARRARARGGTGGGFGTGRGGRRAASLRAPAARSGLRLPRWAGTAALVAVPPSPRPPSPTSSPATTARRRRSPPRRRARYDDHGGRSAGLARGARSAPAVEGLRGRKPARAGGHRRAPSASSRT